MLISLPIRHGIARVMLAASLTALTVSAAAADCLAGAEQCPIPVHMKAGTDTITVAGRLRQNVDCCSYSLDARAGQTLTWSFTGPNVDTTIVYPDGDEDGPGVPTAIPLPQTGTYVFGVSPDLMAENIFGPFKLTFTIK